MMLWFACLDLNSKKSCAISIWVSEFFGCLVMYVICGALFVQYGGRVGVGSVCGGTMLSISKWCATLPPMVIFDRGMFCDLNRLCLRLRRDLMQGWCGMCCIL